MIFGFVAQRLQFPRDDGLQAEGAGSDQIELGGVGEVVIPSIVTSSKAAGTRSVPAALGQEMQNGSSKPVSFRMAKPARMNLTGDFH